MEKNFIIENETLIKYIGNEKIVSIPSFIKVIGKEAFLDCSFIKEIYMPIFVNKINEGAFKNCTSLKLIMLPNHINTIPSRCFENCISLKEIDIPKSVEKIEKYAFLSCKNLKKLIIPSSVKFLDDKAFLNCDKLKIINNKKDYFCQLKITNCTNVNKVIELLKIKDYKIHQDEIILKEIKSDEYDAEDILYETIKDFIDKEEVILNLLETLNISFELSLSSLNKDYLGLFIVKQEITRFIYISKAKCINFDVF